MIYIPRD